MATELFNRLFEYHCQGVLYLSSFFFYTQDASIKKNIMRAGVNRGLKECRRLFKDEVWDCSFYNESVTGELPDFILTTLPYGRFSDDYFMHHRQSDLPLLSLIQYIRDIQGSPSSFYFQILLFLLIWT